ncbi:MAG: Ig-like domain-containing domain, partial [Planctomycetota bacterium]
MRKTTSFILGAALLGVVACENNVGSIFDPDVGGGGGGSGDATNIQALPVGGIAIDGRPRVTDVFPEGDGWPSAVPIVVVFNESMNEESIVPPASTGRSPTIFLRLAGTDQPLPADYDFLLAGTVVLIRPLVPLTDLTDYEVVVDPEVRDTDAARVGGDLQVVAEFTVDEDPAETDGRILTTLPVDNENDQLREVPVYTIFNKPANVASVTTSNFRMQTAAGTPIPGNLSFPLEITAGVADGRVLRFNPASTLDPNTDQEIFYENTITFPGTPPGQLDFGNRSPYAEFRTQDVEQPAGVTVGNTTPQFPDKINIQNITGLMIDVDLPASTLPGDTVVVRIYGLDPQTETEGDVNFVERSAAAIGAGAQTVTVNLTSALGTALSPRFDDGSVTITARQTRGSRTSGVIHSAAANDPRLDVTLPSLVTLGPPTGSAVGDMVTDLQHLSLYGTASEELGGAILTGMAPVSGTANLYAGAADGSFILAPLFLGRLTGPVSATLELVDAAGNATTAMPLAGMIIQRGVVTGSVGAGMSLTVEAYDESTLEAIPGVTVLLDAASPDPGGVGQIAQVTGVNGQTTFTGLTNSSYSVTLVATGFELFSLVNTSAGFASLPLRPRAAATGNLAATLLFPP